MVLVPSHHQRHTLMDVSRGGAILGILWLNIFIFAMPFEAMVIPGIWGEHNTLNIFTWNFVSVGISGVMRGMIAILFGAAALVMIRNAEKSDDKITGLDRFFRRLLLLIAFGVLHSYVLLWPHDILYVYGVIGLLIFPFRNLAPRRMLALALIMLAGSIIFTAESSNEIQDAQSTVDETLSNEELQQLRQQPPLIDNHDDDRSMLSPETHKDWGTKIVPASSIPPQHAQPNATTTESDLPNITNPEASLEGIDKEFSDLVERISYEIERRQTGYVENFFSMASEAFEEQTTEMLSNHLLDVGTFFLFGMLLFKTGFLTNGWTTQRYVFYAATGYTVGIVLGLLTSLNFTEGSLLAPVSSAVSDYSYDIRRLCLAVANFSLLAIMLRLGVARFLTDSLAACGRMAFSLYISQTIICNIIFLGFGFGFYGQLEHYEIAVLAIVITLLQLIVAVFYMRHFKQGPLEWLLRTLINVGLPATNQHDTRDKESVAVELREPQKA